MAREPVKSGSSLIRDTQSSPQYDVSSDGQHFLALRRPGSREVVQPIEVLNWFQEVADRMAAQGGRQP